MPYITYVEKKFSANSLEKIKIANQIIEEYAQQGFDLTVRQLYYQFVARNYIENSMRSYKNLAKLINDARLAGEIDWSRIKDRTRKLESLSHWDSPKDLLDAALKQYRKDMWATQKHRVEVWIEKEALISVIEGICEQYDVPYFACRGFSSQSAMWEAAARFEACHFEGQSPIVIHLGDHDPSGIDMTRDIFDRLELFIEHEIGYDFEQYYDTIVQRIALNMDQVEEFQPPPNPAKLSDSRALGYIKQYKTQDSWELDALNPQYIKKIIEDKIKEFIDEDKWAKREDEIEDDRDKIQTFIDSLDDTTEPE